jgi:hypothetical protein
MTRHGMVQTSVAGVPPPATDPHAPIVTLAADNVATSRVPNLLDRAKAQRSGLSASISALADDAYAIADISHSSKSP